MPKRKCTVSEEMLKTFPSMKKANNNSELFCIICSCNLSIAHKGKKDIEEHIKTEKHNKKLKEHGNTSKLDNFLMTTNQSKMIKAAEVTLAYHTVKHHQSYHSMDCTIKVNCFNFNVMFNINSEIIFRFIKKCTPIQLL